jgi:hypothetical protein
MKDITTLQILTTLTNEDCALHILFFLRKNYFSRLMIELLPEINKGLVGLVGLLGSCQKRPHHRRLQNYVLQSKRFNVLRTFRSGGPSCNQTNQTLYYWGSPYHFSKNRDRQSKPVIRIANLSSLDVENFIRYYDEGALGIKKPSLPIFAEGGEFLFTEPSCPTIFTQIIEPRKWWEMEFDGFLYTFKKEQWWWEIDDTGEVFILDCPGISSFEAWKNRKLPRPFNLRLTLRKLCRENNLVGWGKYSIKGLFTFLTKTLD